MLRLEFLKKTDFSTTNSSQTGKAAEIWTADKEVEEFIK